MVRLIKKSDKVFESSFNYPKATGLLEPIIAHESEFKRVGNTMEFKITFTYQIEELYTSQVYDVYKTDMRCDLLTDGALQPEELYQGYQVLEKEFLSLLSAKHKNSSIPLLKDLHLLPFEVLQDELVFHIQKFLNS